MNIKSNKKWFSIFHPEKFKLLLYYSITSFIVISIVSFVVGEIFSRMERNALIERSEKYAGYIVSNINHALYEKFFIPSIKDYGQVDKENDHEQLEKLGNIIKSNIYGLNIKKIYLFDMDGQVIYSNIQDHTGYVLEKGKNYELDYALNGLPSTSLQPAGLVDSKGALEEETLLESYYPVYEYINGVVNSNKQVGVIEIYQDIKDLDIQIAGTHRKAVIMTSSSMVLLFLTLLLIVKKASSVIRLKTNQLIEARNHLEEKVEERTLQIKQTYDRLQETQERLSKSAKLAAIGTLAAGVAHEINNPLASVASCAEGLMGRINNIEFKSNDDKEVFPDYLKTIYDETYRCKSITSKLMDFSRQHEPVFKKVDINCLITDVVKLIERQTSQEKLRFVLDLCNRPLTIYGDTNQLKQVLINIIINAQDAIKDGEGIKISTKEINNCVQISLEDKGTGIASEHLDKIFEPFFTTKAPGKGIGLGLSICYGIIEEHKGKISVSSNGIGKGTTFNISLPIYDKVKL